MTGPMYNMLTRRAVEAQPRNPLIPESEASATQAPSFLSRFGAMMEEGSRPSSTPAAASPAPTAAVTAKSAPTLADMPHAATELAIRQASRKLQGNIPTDSLRLSKLRAELSHIPREDLDAALLNMRKEGSANLMNLDNPRDIAAEGDAVLKNGRQLFHTVWLNR